MAQKRPIGDGLEHVNVPPTPEAIREQGPPAEGGNQVASPGGAVEERAGGRSQVSELIKPAARGGSHGAGAKGRKAVDRGTATTTTSGPQAQESTGRRAAGPYGKAPGRARQKDNFDRRAGGQSRRREPPTKKAIVTETGEAGGKGTTSAAEGVDDNTCAATGRQASQEASTMKSSPPNSAVVGVGAGEGSISLQGGGRRKAEPPKANSAAGSKSQKDSHVGVIRQVIESAVASGVATTINGHRAQQIVHIQVRRAEASKKDIPRRSPPGLAGDRP